MIASIPAHWLRPPSFPYPHISREGLLKRLYDMRCRIIFVEAGGGYGKSVAAADLVHTLPAPAAWFPLEHLADKSAPAFVWNLIEAIRAIWPNWGAQSLAFLQEFAKAGTILPGETWLFSVILPILVNELAALASQGEDKVGVWIVLENYHLIQDAELDRVLVDMVEQAPDGIHLIITSRMALAWPQRAAWQERGWAANIGEQDLAFTRTEGRVLAHKIGAVFSQEQTATVYDRVGGWPFLHRLIYSRCQGKEAQQVTEVLQLLDQPTGRIYENLAILLLQTESRSARDFLCRTSLLPTLDPTTCNALLDMDDAGQLLHRLGSGPFLRVIESEGSQAIYYMHSHEIIREFLQQALDRDYDPGDVTRLRKRLGEIYEERGEYDQAIAHYCQGGHFAEASRLVRIHGSYLVSAIQLPRLAAWLKHFPQEWIQADPALLLYRGFVLANTSNRPLADDCFRRARQLFQEQYDTEGMAWAAVELGWSHYLKGEYSEAGALLRPTLEEDLISPRLRARALHYLAITLHGADQFDQAVEYGIQATQLLHKLGTSEDQAALSRLLRHLSGLYSSMGQTQEALSLLRQAHELGQALDLGAWALAWIDNEWGMCCFHSGQFDEARIHLDEAECLLAPYRALNLQLPLLGFVTIARGHLCQEMYDYEQAEAIYRQVKAHAGIWAGLRLAQPGRAGEALEMAQVTWNELGKSNSPVIRAKGEMLLGLAYLGTEDYVQAQAHLEHAAAALEHYGAIHALTTTRMYLAKAYLAIDQLSKALQCLRYAFSQMAKRDYYMLLLWQPWIMAEMCAQALLNGIEPGFVEKLAIRRLAAAHADPFFPLLTHADESVRRQASHILYSLVGEQTIQLQARERLNQCKDMAIKARLITWLDAGWLTAEGMLRLRDVLAWRRLEIFLLWISPRLHGGVQDIHKELHIEVDTINTTLREIRNILADKMSLELPAGKGAYMVAYDWAVRQGLINPHASPPSTSAIPDRKNHI